MEKESDFRFNVTDVKQFLYCPRIPYFLYVVPVPKRPTAKMDLGKAEHEIVEELEERRLLRKYGLDEGKRDFRVRLSSARLRLSGILDLLISGPTGHFPVEFKFSSRKPALNHKYQLAAYGLLVEEAMGAPVHQGYLYFHPLKQIYPVPLTQGVKDFTKRILRNLWDQVRTQRFPEGTRQLARCRECEYRLYCGDR